MSGRDSLFKLLCPFMCVFNYNGADAHVLRLNLVHQSLSSSCYSQCLVFSHPLTDAKSPRFLFCFLSSHLFPLCFVVQSALLRISRPINIQRVCATELRLSACAAQRVNRNEDQQTALQGQRSIIIPSLQACGPVAQ